jgi:hypothetical protein
VLGDPERDIREDGTDRRIARQRCLLTGADGRRERIEQAVASRDGPPAAATERSTVACAAATFAERVAARSAVSGVAAN